MKKTEFLKQYEIYKQFDEFIYDRWIDHILKQNNITFQSKEYRHVLEGTATCYCLQIDFDEETITINWGVENDDTTQSETLPLTVFYDDENDQPDLKLLWHRDYYDHPLTGLALYNGEKVWFRAKPADDCIERDIFELLQLTPEQLQQIEQQHSVFQTFVGRHCDHDPNVYQPFSPDPERNSKFYSMKLPQIDLSTCPIITTVEWFQFKQWNRPR